MRFARAILLFCAFCLLTLMDISVANGQIDASTLMKAQRGGGRNGRNPLGGYGQNPYNQNGQYDPNNPYAQYDPNNPNGEGEENQGEQQDTTKKKRERKPNESYFFSDSIRALRNFEWHIKRNYNKVDILPLDTTLSAWRIDYPHQRNGLGNNSVGGLGQASTEINYVERTHSREFTFSQPYDAYTYNTENVPFYNMKHPFIWLTYLESGQKRYREEHFEITMSQNVSPSTSFSLNYKARGAMGKYDRARIKNQNFAGTFAHTGKRYSIHGAYYHNYVEQQENGGVAGEWAIKDTTFEMPSGVPMRLASADAKNLYRNNGFFIKQSYGFPLQRMTEKDFSMADLSAVYIGHIFEYNSWNKVYTDKYATYTNERGIPLGDGTYTPTVDSYYHNWYNNPSQTRDSLYERIITNRFYIQAQPWDRNGVVGTIDGGVGIDCHTYSQNSIADYLSGSLAKHSETSWFAYAGVDGKIRKYVDWGADFKLYPSGYRGGDYSFGAHIALRAFIKGKPMILSGEFSERQDSPGYWQEHWNSNHYRFTNSFGKEGETKFQVKFSIPDYGVELGFWQTILRDKIYYGTIDVDNYKEVRPLQHGGSVSLTSIYIQKDFTIKGLHLNHRVLCQFSSNEDIIPVPKVSAYLSYYYEFWVKRDVLRCQFGIDARYNTRYYAQGYDPALSTFYNQHEVKIGNYPYVDLFLSAKWKRMRILIKYQHFNDGLFGNREFFAVARYPLNPSMLRIGISWAFYD